MPDMGCVALWDLEWQVMGFQQILTLSALQIFTDKCRLPTLSLAHSVLVGYVLGIFETSTTCRDTFSIVLPLQGKRSDGTACPQALVPRQGNGPAEAAYGVGKDFEGVGHGGF